MTRALLDAARCRLEQPRWVTVAFNFATFRVCAHCHAKHGTPRHGHARRLP